MDGPAFAEPGAGAEAAAEARRTSEALRLEALAGAAAAEALAAPVLSPAESARLQRAASGG